MVKLRSLRSMLVTLAIAAVFCVGLASSVCSNYVAKWHTFDAAQKAAFNPLDTNFNFLVIGVLFFGVLGALVVTNEYRNGLIRATLAATPQRGVILAAKAALLALIALLSSSVIIFAAFLVPSHWNEPWLKELPPHQAAWIPAGRHHQTTLNAGAQTLARTWR